MNASMLGRMGLKYVEDPGEWFPFTLKEGVR